MSTAERAVVEFIVRCREGVHCREGRVVWVDEFAVRCREGVLCRTSRVVWVDELVVRYREGINLVGG